MAKKTAGPDSLELYQRQLKAIQDNQIAPVYVLTGEDALLSQRIYWALRDKLLTPAAKDLDLLVKDVDEKPAQLDINDLAMHCQTPPFLSLKRLVYVRNSHLFTPGAGQSKERQDQLASLLQHLPATCCLIFHEKKFDRRCKKTLQALEKAGAVILSFDHPNQQALEAYGRRYLLAKDGPELQPDAWQSLVERVACDVARFEQELEKIHFYAEATAQRKLSIDELNEIACPDLNASIFEIGEALAQGNSLQALSILDELIERRERIQGLLTLLARQFRQLICARLMSEKDLARVLGLYESTARRLKKQSQSFDVQRLGALLSACRQSDIAIKSGAIPERVALEILLAQAGRAARWGREQVRRPR